MHAVKRRQHQRAHEGGLTGVATGVGQTIQGGEWKKLTGFLSKLHTHHLVLEVAHRPPGDLEALREVDPKISLGIGVIDVKVNHIETAGEVARRLEAKSPDVPISTGTYMRVAVFDHAQIYHTRHIRPIRIELRK